MQVLRGPVFGLQRQYRVVAFDLQMRQLPVSVSVDICEYQYAMSRVGWFETHLFAVKLTGSAIRYPGLLLKWHLIMRLSSLPSNTSR